MNTPESPEQPAAKTRWAMLLKASVLVLIAVFVMRAIGESRAEFAASHFSLGNVHLGWLAVSAASYVVGMLPMALNWHRLMRAMGQPIPRWLAVQSHFISQLGKYVPGKAFVPAIRLGFLRRYPTDIPTTFLSIVAETLAMMSVGAVVAGVVIAVQFRSRPDIALVAAGLALMSGLPVLPPVLRYALAWLQKRQSQQEYQPTETSQLTWSVIIPGWIGIGVGWGFLGLSMWAAIKALNLPTTIGLPLSSLPWITASYAISVVVGFLSMIPGGFGVREWVLKEMMEPSLGRVAALLAPLLHRSTILLAEITVSGILYAASRGSLGAQVETLEGEKKSVPDMRDQFEVGPRIADTQTPSTANLVLDEPSP